MEASHKGHVRNCAKIHCTCLPCTLHSKEVTATYRATLDTAPHSAPREGGRHGRLQGMFHRGERGKQADRAEQQISEATRHLQSACRAPHQGNGEKADGAWRSPSNRASTNTAAGTSPRQKARLAHPWCFDTAVCTTLVERLDPRRGRDAVLRIRAPLMPRNPAVAPHM